jgi:hypothetical protein
MITLPILFWIMASSCFICAVCLSAQEEEER